MNLLPVGIQSFRKLREEGCVYVDKTELIKSRKRLEDSIEAAFTQIAARKYPERYTGFSGKAFALAIGYTKKEIKCRLKQFH
jgi:hypothetical protein